MFTGKVVRGALAAGFATMTAWLVTDNAANAQTASAPSAVATVDASATGNGLRLVGHALALTAGTFEARMTIEKSGPSGRTATTQGGVFSLVAGEGADVARVDLSAAPGERLAVDLVLTAGGQEVARGLIFIGNGSVAAARGGCDQTGD